MMYGYVKSVKSINCKSKTIKNPWFSTSFCLFRVSPVHRWFTPWWPRLDQQCLLVGGHPNVLLGGQHQELLRRVDGGIGFFWRKGWVGIYIYTQYPVHLEKGKREHVFTSLLLKYLLGNSNLIIPLSFMFQYAQYAPVGMRA